MMNLQNILTTDVIEKALTNKFTCKVNILGYSLEAVVPTGDNYTSDLVRAKVTFRKDEL